MDELLSPKDLATAIGVSESSLKRWVDDGRIQASRTLGGHRRIAVSDAIQFIRRTGTSVVRPELLGFPEVRSAAGRVEDPAQGEQALYDALLAGDRTSALGLIHTPYLSGRPMAWVFDTLLRNVLSRIGQLWQHDEQGILIEHRAVDICIEALVRLRMVLPRTDDSPPAAVGGAPPGDPYLLPSLMAATVVADAGMAETNLGPETPEHTLVSAAIEHDARLVWVSVSVEQAADALAGRLTELAGRLQQIGAELIVGGRATDRLAGIRHSNLTFAATMGELSAFAKGLGRSSNRP